MTRADANKGSDVRRETFRKQLRKYHSHEEICVPAVDSDCRMDARMPTVTPVKGVLAGLLVAAASYATAAEARPPIHDSVRLNIGINCRWERKCIAAQHKAMDAALKYVRKVRPAASRIQMCNRNASRGRNRVDWVGFNNCIRNATLRTRKVGQLRSMRMTRA
jgi:hypothetical protein